MLYRADRLLALLISGKADAEAARELMQVLDELQRIAAATRRQQEPR